MSSACTRANGPLACCEPLAPGCDTALSASRATSSRSSWHTTANRKRFGTETACSKHIKLDSSGGAAGSIRTVTCGGQRLSQAKLVIHCRRGEACFLLLWTRRSSGDPVPNASARMAPLTCLNSRSQSCMNNPAGLVDLLSRSSSSALGWMTAVTLAHPYTSLVAATPGEP